MTDGKFITWHFRCSYQYSLLTVSLVVEHLKALEEMLTHLNKAGLRVESNKNLWNHLLCIGFN